MQIFARLTKVNEENRTVEGIIASEGLDKSGEIFDYATSKPYFEKWSTEIAKATDGKNLGNVRVMHGKQVAGVTKSLTFDDVKKRIRVTAEIVDDNEWNKVQKGCYTGFSIGGKYAGPKWPDTVHKNAQRYTAIPNEYSLVDLPMNPEAQFTVVKADGSTELRKFETTTDDGEAMEKWLGALDDDAFGELANRMLKVQARKDADPKEGEDKYGDVKFADPKNKKYPIDTAAHIRAAWSYINMPKNAAKYSAADVKSIKARIVAAWKDKIGKGGPPSANKDYTPEAERLMKVDGAAEVANSIAAIIGGDQLEKGLYTVSRFACLLEQLAAIADGAVLETKHEGDNSTLPANMAAALKPLAAVFLQMCKEETDEALHGQLNDDASIELARRNEMEKHEHAEQLEALQKRYDAVEAERDELKKANAEIEDLRKVASEVDDLKKGITERDELLEKAAAALDEREELLKHYKAAFDAQPLPVKASLRSFAKGEDIDGDEGAGDEVEKVLNPDGSTNEVASALKKALANPVVTR